MQGARTGSHSYSILQGKSKRCYFTDTETGPLERHHIYFGVGMRQISDKHGFWVWIKPEWRRGTSGVHGRDGHKVDLRLKRDCQRKFEETHTREEFMAIIGRNYLSDEAEQKKTQMPAAPAADAKRGLSVAMGRARDTRHGTGSGKRRSWRGSEGQAYCMKRIKERAQR